MKEKVIDLRSDTITQPTAAMRRSMAEAEVGDDVLGDDPTVKTLEHRVAAILGKEAALFVPSGSMANQVAVRCHTQPGDEMLLDTNAHIYLYEAGAPAALSGVHCRWLPGARGIFTAADVQAALRPKDVHFAPTQLLAIENTHNRGGGSIWPLERIHEVCSVARREGMKTHLDGARLWNASVATGIPESEYATPFDSVSVCFSKGLGAPVGSALVGTTDFIHRARRFRKQFGGAMRQVGIVAAGALHALTHHRDRLVEDHANARRLGFGLSEIPQVRLKVDEIETNMVYFSVEECSAAQVVDKLKAKGVLMLPTGQRMIRAVTSLAVDSEDMIQAVAAVRAAAQGNA